MGGKCVPREADVCGNKEDTRPYIYIYIYIYIYTRLHYIDVYRK